MASHTPQIAENSKAGVYPDQERIRVLAERYRASRSRNLGKLLHIGWRQYSSFVEAKMASLGYGGFRTTMMAVLANLDAEGNTIVELAERVRHTKQAMGKLVRDIEKAGYVHLVTHPADKRAQLVRLTHRGVDLMEDACNHLNLVRQEFTRSLSDEEIDTMLSLMLRLVDSNLGILEPGKGAP